MKKKHLLNITVPGEYTSHGRDATLWCEIERSADSIILQTDGKGKGTYPLLLKSDLDAAGVEAQAGIPYDDCPVEVQNLALRFDDQRIKWGHIYADERADVEAWLAGELDDPNNGSTLRREKREKDRKEERKRGNAFLKEKGYTWKRISLYLYDPGEFTDGWALIDQNGDTVFQQEVIAGGTEISTIDGKVKNLLIELGFYGEEAIEAKREYEANAAEHRKMREAVDAYFNNDSNCTGETFDDAQAEFTTNPVYIESHYPRRRFRIESECLWHESHNISDGDMWSLNNCDYGIASQYKFDGTIAEYLKALAK